MNDVVWRAIKRLRYQQLMSPSVSYSKMENVPMAPDCYFEHEASPWHGTSQFLTSTLTPTHIDQTAREACSAANKAAANKIVKYGTLSASHIFLPAAVETAGTWNQSAIELIQESGRCITAVTEDTRDTVFLFQRLFIALQRRNAVTFLATFDAVWCPAVVVVFCLV